MTVGRSLRGRSGFADTPWRPRTLSDWLFMLLPSAAAIGSAFGSVSILGISFYPFKVLVPILFALVLSQYRQMPRRGVPIIWMSVGLATWASITVAWSPAGSEALQEATIFLFLVLLLVTAFKAIGTNWFPSLIFGWPLAIFTTGAITVWELITGAHLESDFILQRAATGWRAPLSTFGNPNNHGSFLALALTLSLIALSMGDVFGRLTRRAIGAAMIFALVALPLTASRLAFLGLLSGLLIYAALILRGRRGQRLVLLGAMLMVPLLAVALRTSPDLAAKLSTIAAESTATGNSATIRENLILNGWDFFVNSAGTGVGAAGYEALILAGEFRHPLFDRAINPHNMWIEILSEYGVIGIVLVGLILAAALSAASPLRLPSWFGAAYLAAFVTYFIAAMTASSYVNDAVSWAYFSTFVALGIWAGDMRTRQVAHAG